MLAMIIVSVTVFWLILVGEYIARIFPKYPEFTRKFVHITVGSFVAFWPLILSWNQIVLMSIAFVAVVSVSKYFHIFSSIHGIKRATWGEVYFGAVVGIIALVTQDGWIYMAALLHMSLADGFAAVVGMRYGKGYQYSVLGSLKSVVGTITFFVISLAILIFYAQHDNFAAGYLPLLSLALCATALENAGMRGLDNLTVPLVVAVMLTLLNG
jgi:phytol kinase